MTYMTSLKRTKPAEYEVKSGTEWTVAEAKARFSEVIDQARERGAQTVTRHGRVAAMIVSVEEWAQKTQRRGNLAEFLAESPLRGSRLRTTRATAAPDDVEL